MKINKLYRRIVALFTFRQKSPQKEISNPFLESLEFRCPHCNGLLAIDVKWRHAEVECPACGNSLVPEEAIVRSEERERQAEEKSVSETLTEMLEFTCPRCDTLLAVERKWRHTEVECPSCRSFLVPAEAIVKYARQHRPERIETEAQQKLEREEGKLAAARGVSAPIPERIESTEEVPPTVLADEISQPTEVVEKPLEQVRETPAKKPEPKKQGARGDRTTQILRKKKRRQKPAKQICKPKVGKPRLEKRAVCGWLSGKIPQSGKVKEERHIIIGLDFGTSGTKVLYRDFEREEVYPMKFDRGIQQYANFIFPSVVSLVGKDLYFGTGPDSVSRVFRSLKRCMGCQVNVFPNEGCPHYENRDKCFSVTDNNLADVHIPVKYLCAWYLGYVLACIREVIDRKYGDRYDIRPTYNMGIPIDHYQNQRSRKLFSDTFLVAERLSEKMRDGVPFSQLGQITGYQFSRVDEIPKKETCTYVLPETIAAIISDILDFSYQQEDKHAIVDVGAGTTDITVFCLPGVVAGRNVKKLHSYHAEAFPIGVDNIDEEILERLKKGGNRIEKRDSLLCDIRSARERAKTSGSLRVALGGNGYSLSRRAYTGIISSIADGIYEKYRHVWWKAYEKRKKEKLWKELTLFRIGGGNRIAGISKRLGCALPLSDGSLQGLTLGKLNLPPDLKTNPTNGENWVKENYDFFAVAYGLALCPHKWNADDIVLSDRIKPLARPRVIKRPDRDELYQRK